MRRKLLLAGVLLGLVVAGLAWFAWPRGPALRVGMTKAEVDAILLKDNTKIGHGAPFGFELDQQIGDGDDFSYYTPDDPDHCFFVRFRDGKLVGWRPFYDKPPEPLWRRAARTFGR
jgi:hypothetical protein